MALGNIVDNHKIQFSISDFVQQIFLIMAKENKYPPKDASQSNVNEPMPVYTQDTQNSSVITDYVTLEEFRIEAKKRARKLLKENGIDS